MNDHDGHGGLIGMTLLHLACCAGAALLLALTGAGVATAGIVKASLGPLLGGSVVVGVGLAWRAARKRRSPSMGTCARQGGVGPEMERADEPAHRFDARPGS